MFPTTSPAPLATADFFSQMVRETMTVATRTGTKAHAAVHGDRQTFCGADTQRMLEIAEGWDSVNCAKCRTRCERNVQTAMQYAQKEAH